jgi:predicted nucleic acid-binding protein
VTKAVLDASIIIALSSLGYLAQLKLVFDEILVPRAVFAEVCQTGRHLIGSHELDEAVNKGYIVVRNVDDRVLVNALIEPLGTGESEAIAMASEEQVEYLVMDDRLARRRAESMGLNVIGTLGVLRLMLDREVLSRDEVIKALQKLKELGFRLSDEVMIKALKEL